MESVINDDLLQLNFIDLQSNNKAYSTCSHKMYHQMSRLHRMLNTEWKCYDASDYACPVVRTLNNLFLKLESYIMEGSKCCLAGPVCPSKMLPSNDKNSSTI